MKQLLKTIKIKKLKNKNLFIYNCLYGDWWPKKYFKIHLVFNTRWKMFSYKDCIKLNGIKAFMKEKLIININFEIHLVFNTR